jgi:signal transduction histidine kinase
MLGMTRTQRPAWRFDFLTLTTYLTLLAVGSAGILEIPLISGRWLALGLLILFGLLVSPYVSGNVVSDRRKDIYYLTLLTLMVLLLNLLSPGRFIFGLLFFILSAIAMLINEARLGAAWIGLFSAISAYNLIRFNGWEEGLGLWLAFSAGFLFFGQIANALRQANRSRHESERLLAELSQMNTRLQEYASQAETLAVVEERNYLAREMHDTIGHRLTVASVQLEGAQRLIPNDPERAASLIDTVREQVRAALTDLRQTVARLRDPVEADLSLHHSIGRLASYFEEATGLAIAVEIPDTLPPINGQQRMAIFRAAQEGLTNVQKHARAERAWISLANTPDGLRLLVSDDGGGLRNGEPVPGFGLTGLQERAQQLGGRVVLSERPDGGACLEFLVRIH